MWVGSDLLGLAKRFPENGMAVGGGHRSWLKLAHQPKRTGLTSPHFQTFVIALLFSG